MGSWDASSVLVPPRHRKGVCRDERQSWDSQPVEELSSSVPCLPRLMAELCARNYSGGWGSARRLVQREITKVISDGYWAFGNEAMEAELQVMNQYPRGGEMPTMPGVVLYACGASCSVGALFEPRNSGCIWAA